MVTFVCGTVPNFHQKQRHSFPEGHPPFLFIRISARHPIQTICDAHHPLSTAWQPWRFAPEPSPIAQLGWDSCYNCRKGATRSNHQLNRYGYSVYASTHETIIVFFRTNQIRICHSMCWSDHSGTFLNLLLTQIWSGHSSRPEAALLLDWTVTLVGSLSLRVLPFLSLCITKRCQRKRSTANTLNSRIQGIQWTPPRSKSR